MTMMVSIHRIFKMFKIAKRRSVATGITPNWFYGLQQIRWDVISLSPSIYRDVLFDEIL